MAVKKFNRTVKVFGEDSIQIGYIQISRNNSIVDIQPRIVTLFEKMYGRQADEYNLQYIASIIVENNKNNHDSNY
jgi:hypothetical protein